MTRIRFRVPTLALAVVALAATAASPTPVGPARWLEDIGDLSVVDAATAPDGRLALLLGACSGGQCDLEIRRYDADGQPAGPGLFVATVEAESVPRGYGSIGIDAAGQLVVALPDSTQGQLMCFQPDGTKVEHSFRSGFSEGSYPQDLVMLGNGDFVVGWTQDGIPFGGNYHNEYIRIRRFEVATCAPVAAAQTLESHRELIGSRPLSDVRDLNLAASPNGRLAAAWVSQDRMVVSRLKMKTFNPSGAVVVGTKTVATLAPGTAGDVGIDDQGRTVAIYHPPGDGVPGQAAIRRYSAFGVAQAPVPIDGVAFPGDDDVQIGVSASGDFVAGWTSFPEAADSFAVLRHFDATAGTLGDATPVTSNAGHFAMVDVLQRGDGGFTAVYAEFFAGDVPPRYYVRRYQP